jgi:hypothetical protein
MTDRDEALIDLLKRTAGGPADPELRGDLWPRMRRRLDDRAPLRVSSWDWVLAAALLVCLILFPEIIPALLYQF